LHTKEKEKMSVQNISGSCGPDGRLALRWEVFDKPIAISIQVALDTEFTQEARTFVVPKTATTCGLDIGAGKWFYRMGGWIGTDTDGAIDWSGIYGPVQLQSKKGYIRCAEFPTIVHATPANNAIVFHTGLYEPYYIVLHCTQKGDFKASGLKSYYKKDWGSASVQLSGLDAQYTYSFQFQMLSEEKAVLPTNTIRLLTDVYSIKNKKTAMPVRATTNTEHAVYAGDKALLMDAVGRRQQKFDSYADYLRFQAAKARTSASQQ
jgi:hypothetical protein